MEEQQNLSTKLYLWLLKSIATKDYSKEILVFGFFGVEIHRPSIIISLLFSFNAQWSEGVTKSLWP